MAKKIVNSDLRQVGEVVCMRCKTKHKLSDLRKETLKGVDYYFCEKAGLSLAMSAEDGRVIPIVGNSFI